MTELTSPSSLQPAKLGAPLHLGVIRLPRLLQILGISRSTVYLKINQQSKYYDKKFPRPIKLGEKAIGWMLQDVLDYLEGIKSFAKQPS